MNNTQRRVGFTLVEIMIVVAIIGILAAIAIPQLIESRKMSRLNKCVAHMKLYEYSKEQAALNLDVTSGQTMDYSYVESFIKDGDTPDLTRIQCPLGGTYSNQFTQGTDTSCSIHGSVSGPSALSALTSD